MQANNQIRRVHLYRERYLEIVREGVPAAYSSSSGLQRPEFQIDPSNAAVISQWMKQKYTINVYDSETFQQACMLDKSSAYLEEDRLKLLDRKLDTVLADGHWYYIAKNNATSSVLCKVLSQTHRVNAWIDAFINDDTVFELPPNPLFYPQEWFNLNMNETQQAAISNVVNNPLTFIKGPPGCGKTKLIARLCSIFAYHQCKVLVGAASNTATVAIVQALIKESYQMGFEPNIVLFIPKELSTQNMALPPEIRRLTFRQKVIANYLQINQGTQYTEQQLVFLLDQYYSNFNASRTFFSVYLQAVAKTFLEATVIVSTCISATKLSSKLLESQRFMPQIGILDEAAQASWGDAYCFLCQGVQKMVFVGDDRQLSPTVISQNQLLKETMFTNLHGKNPSYYTLLNQQYRMHPAIAEFPNAYFYQGALLNGVTADDRASRIPFFDRYPHALVNCQTQENEEVQWNSGKKNYWNQGEIDIILQVMKVFPNEEYCNVGIISPYDQQVRMITAALGWDAYHWGLTVSTCDGYQGSEKDYIIFSCVRSNALGKIGFCGEQNRVNVSLTRARKGLLVIGNEETFGSEQADTHVWKTYLSFMRERNLIIPASTLPTLIEGQAKVQIQPLTFQFLDSEVEQQHEAFKASKKRIKRALGKYRNTQQKDSLREDLLSIMDPSEATVVRVTRRQMDLYHDLESIEGPSMSHKLSQKLEQLVNAICSTQQFNHLKQSKLIDDLIELQSLYLIQHGHARSESK